MNARALLVGHTAGLFGERRSARQPSPLVIIQEIPLGEAWMIVQEVPSSDVSSSISRPLVTSSRMARCLTPRHSPAASPMTDELMAPPRALI